MSSTSFAPLPRSFYFLTISRGSGMRTFALRASLVHLAAVVLPVFALLGLGAILTLLFHDDLVAALMANQSRMQYAYEDRIDALNGDLQREATRQIKDQATIEAKLQNLVLRASTLEGRNAVLASLAPKPVAAAGPGAASGAVQAIADLPMSKPAASSLPIGRRPTSLPAGLIGFAPLPPRADPPSFPPKPHPEADADEGPAAVAKPADHVSTLDPGRLPLPLRISMIDVSLSDVERSQFSAVSRLELAARDETARLNAVLEKVGLSSERFHRAEPAAAGMGGPFVPLPEDNDGAFGAASAPARASLALAAHLRRSVERVPLVSPVAGSIEVTSPFGARLDPFLGRPALHTGVDLKEDFGIGAKATAAGKVVFAGAMGGYGNMVEIDHGNGLTSRYAHLEAILVSVGQTVARGEAVGQVGATGRATGPHLHYEVRIDGEPVDPMRFITAGVRMAALAEH